MKDINKEIIYILKLINTAYLNDNRKCIVYELQNNKFHEYVTIKNWFLDKVYFIETLFMTDENVIFRISWE
jgi:hypothetical protein